VTCSIEAIPAAALIAIRLQDALDPY